MWATGTALCDDIAGFDAKSGSESSHVAFTNLLLYARDNIGPLSLAAAHAELQAQDLTVRRPN